MNFTRKVAILCIIVLLGTMINFESVHASGSFSVSGGGTVSPGGKGTVTINANNCAGYFTITASNGGKLSSSKEWIDDSSKSITVTAPSSGSTTVTVTAIDVSSYEGASITGSRSVTFTVKTSSSDSGSSGSGSSSGSSSSGSSNSSQTEKSSNTNLKTLTTSVGVLSPSFSNEVTDYKLYINEDDKECVISATPEDSKSKVSLSGSSEIGDGSEGRTITVTAENGDKREYKITYAFLEEDNIIFDEKIFTVVDRYDASILPKGLEETKIEYMGEKIPAFESKDKIFILVILEDDAGNLALYMYNEDEEMFALAETIEVDGDVFLLVGLNYMHLYGDNGLGEGYYMYNLEDGTLIYMDGQIVEEEPKLWLYIGLGAVGALLLITIILQIKIIRSRRYQNYYFEEYESSEEDEVSEILVKESSPRKNSQTKNTKQPKQVNQNSERKEETKKTTEKSARNHSKTLQKEKTIKEKEKEIEERVAKLMSKNDN